MGIANPLLITELGLVKLPAALPAPVFLYAVGLGRALFSDVDPNPNEINLAGGFSAFRDGSYNEVTAFYNGVTAFGGGASLDLEKLVAFMASQTRPI